MCGNRANELGWAGDEEVAQKCMVCLTWLMASGICPQCDNRMDNDLGYGLMVMEHAYRFATPVALTEFLERDGQLTVSEGFETARPGWSTLGSPSPWNLPAKVRPEYAAIHGGGLPS